MSATERAINWLLGVTVLSWAYMGMRETWVETGGVTPVRCAGSAIHLCAGLLFIVRRPMTVVPKGGDLLVILPSMVIGGMLFRLAPSTDSWGIWGTALFLLGAVVVVTSLLTLGRNFDLVPAARGITRGGLYGGMRHPAYLGELVMALGCGLAIGQWIAAPLFLALIPAMIWRIRAEEILLRNLPAYQEYEESVPWKLIPGIW